MRTVVTTMFCGDSAMQLKPALVLVLPPAQLKPVRSGDVREPYCVGRGAVRSNRSIPQLERAAGNAESSRLGYLGRSHDGI